MDKEIVGVVKFPRVLQWTDATCATCSMYSLLKYFGVDVSYAALKADLIERLVTTWRGMADFVTAQGLEAHVLETATLTHLKGLLALGALMLVELDEGHVGVVHAMSADRVWLADPSILRQWTRSVSYEQFLARWTSRALVVAG